MTKEQQENFWYHVGHFINCCYRTALGLSPVWVIGGLVWLVVWFMGVL